MSLYMHKKSGTVARYLILSWRSNCVTGPNILCNFAPRRPACLSRPGHTRHFYLPPEKEITQNIRCVNSFFTSKRLHQAALKWTRFRVTVFPDLFQLPNWWYSCTIPFDEWWTAILLNYTRNWQYSVDLMLRKRKFKIGFANNTPSVNSIGLCLQFTVYSLSLYFSFSSLN